MKKCLAIMAALAAFPIMAEYAPGATISNDVPKRRSAWWGRHPKFIIKGRIKEMMEQLEEIRANQKARAYERLKNFVRREAETFDNVQNFTTKEHDRMIENILSRAVELAPLTAKEIWDGANEMLKELSLEKKQGVYQP